MSAFKPFIMANGELVINDAHILLFKEFDVIYNAEEGREWAFRVFKYLWLRYDYMSYYSELAEVEQERTAREDCNFTAVDFTDDRMTKAIDKYQKLQKSRKLKMLLSARGVLDKMRLFYDNIDFSDEDDKGKLKHDSGKVLTQIGNLGKAYSGLDDLEIQVKKEMEVGSGIRGDAEMGFQDEMGGNVK